ncbi:hypothetical protein [Bacillus cereus]|uniref:hypothetical protein n=1 Tax=Bacillus cereus TaxID=1396 RepID=UPI0030130B4F
MRAAFNLVSEEKQKEFEGKRIMFELPDEVFYGRVNAFTKGGVEIKWEGNGPNDNKLGGIVTYANVGRTLEIIRIAEEGGAK